MEGSTIGAGCYSSSLGSDDVLSEYYKAVSYLRHRVVASITMSDDAIPAHRLSIPRLKFVPSQGFLIAIVTDEMLKRSKMAVAGFVTVPLELRPGGWKTEDGTSQ